MLDLQKVNRGETDSQVRELREPYWEDYHRLLRYWGDSFMAANREGRYIDINEIKFKYY